MYANFGDLGMAVKDLLETYQAKVNDNKNISSIADMQRFVESYPQFKAMSTNVSKHVAVMSELSRLVDEHALMDLSVLEQDMACTNDHSSQLEELRAKLRDGNVSNVDAVRLVMLYALRYETLSGNQIRQMKTILEERGVRASDIAALDSLMQYAGASKRAGDLYGNQSLGARLTQLRKGLVGVQNVYTQHKPTLSGILEAATKNKLKEALFPCVSGPANREKPRTVVVFMIGGITYEEAAAVAAVNEANPDVQVVLGGSCVHNSKSFLAELEQLGMASAAGYK
jgi:hypothetical protein